VTSRDVRADELAELHARLADEVAALRTGEDWRRGLTATARLHEYSFQNRLLILGQRPDATTVAGYQTKALGCQVNRGEKGIAILAPILRRPSAADAGNGAEDQPRLLAGLRITCVWDIKQTSGPPLPLSPQPNLCRASHPRVRGTPSPGSWPIPGSPSSARRPAARTGRPTSAREPSPHPPGRR
jgi:hypothetical protein